MAMHRFSKALQILSRLAQPTSSDAIVSLTVASKSHSTFSPDNPNNCYVSYEQRQIVNELISIFSKTHPLLSPQSQYLSRLSQALTTRIVEHALGSFKNWDTAYSFFNWASKQPGYTHNGYTFNAMASVLSRARQNDAMRALVSEAMESNFPVSPGGLGFFLRCLGSLELVEEANALFDHVEKNGLCDHDEYSYTCLMEVIAKSGSAHMIEKRLTEMMGFGYKVTKFTFMALLVAYYRAGEFNKVLKVFDYMNERGLVDGVAYGIIAVSFCKEGRVDKALETLEKMIEAKYELNEKSFYVLINGFVRVGRVEEALGLFDRMRKLGMKPSISLFDVMILGFSRTQNFERVLCLYEDMKKSGIRPDARVVVKVVDCCPSEEDMIRLLEDSHRVVDQQEATLLYQSVLTRFVRAGLTDKALKLFRVMIGDEASSALFEVNKFLKISDLCMTSCFEIVVNGLLDRRDLDKAIGLVKDMIRIGGKLDQSACDNLIGALCSSDRLEESYEILKGIQSCGLSATGQTYNSLYRCECQRENVSGALDLIKHMRTQGQKALARHSSLFLVRLCQNGKIAQACSFLDGTLREGFDLDSISFSTVLDCLVKTGEVNQALHLLRHVRDQNCCADVTSYKIMINGLSKAQRPSEAEELVGEMIANERVPSVATYNMVMDGWCRLGDMDRATIWLTKMIEEKKDPNVVTFTTIINGLCTAGNPDDAEKIFNSMGLKSCPPNRATFMALICGLCKCDRPDTALSYLRKMEENKMSPDSFVYVALLSAFLSDLNITLAFDVLEEMVEKDCLPGLLENNHSVVKDAILRFLADDRTSPSVKALIAEGRLATFKI